MWYPYSVGIILDRYGYLNPEAVESRLRYSTFVDVAKRFLYFEVPKAACTEMKQLLRRLGDAPPLKFSGGRQVRRDMFVHVR